MTKDGFPLFSSEMIDEFLHQSEDSVLASEWEQALLYARAAGETAERAGDRVRMILAADHLDRLSDWQFSGHLHAAAGRMKSPNVLPEWDGSPLSDRTLLILRRTRHIGAQLRDARLIAAAARGARRCTLLAEPRLVSLFRRSFPEVEVLVGPEDQRKTREAADLVADIVGADVIASYETLIEHLATDAATLRASFRPLRPDTDRVQTFRDRYFRSGQRTVGICWRSTNPKKDLPALSDWVGLLQSPDTTFVSLQYGNVGDDIVAFQSLSGSEIIRDESIDSLADLDAFAAQVAAMDAVVTISNTGAHMAGALGIPTIILLDDKVHLVWPVRGTETAWYPSVSLIRKHGRPWGDVIVEARDLLFDRGCSA